MRVRTILGRLPPHLSWFVLFRIRALTPFVRHDTLTRMFSLPATLKLASFSHVVLTAGDRILVPRHGGMLLAADGRSPAYCAAGPQESMLNRHRARFAALPIDDADCVGAGSRPDRRTAFLCLKIVNGIGEAVAHFECEPSAEGYELLTVVGVRYLGGSRSDDVFVAHYRHDTRAHLVAASRAGFRRTENCNAFFLNHGNIDPVLSAGLQRVFQDRLLRARIRAARVVRKLAGDVLQRPLAASMRCRPPPPEVPHASGDVAPLGFLLRALRGLAAEPAPGGAAETLQTRILCCELRRRLLHLRRGELWSFHAGGLVTATDSALVMLGLKRPASLRALERFWIGDKGCLPQLHDCAVREQHMRRVFGNQHWCQIDMPTSCMVRALHHEAGFPPRLPLRIVESWCAHRGGLFFANPYLVDWSFALAIQHDAEAAALRSRLAAEVIASANADGSFGCFDVPLSTALAVLTLVALGCCGKAVRRAQIRLLLMVDAPTWPVPTPFYSTFQMASPPEDEFAHSGHFFRVEQSWHELSLYEDQHQAVFSALASLALSAETGPGTDLPGMRPEGPVHPRYRCPHAQAYVSDIALRPYLSDGMGRTSGNRGADRSHDERSHPS